MTAPTGPRDGTTNNPTPSIHPTRSDAGFKRSGGGDEIPVLPAPDREDWKQQGEKTPHTQQVTTGFCQPGPAWTATPKRGTYIWLVVLLAGWNWFFGSFTCLPFYLTLLSWRMILPVLRHPTQYSIFAPFAHPAQYLKLRTRFACQSFSSSLVTNGRKCVVDWWGAWWERGGGKFHSAHLTMND